MKKGIRKLICVIGVLAMIFQMIMPAIPGIGITVLAVENVNSETEIQTETLTQVEQSEQQGVTAESSESGDTTQTEEISRNYEIKKEETWDVSINGDGSVMAKWTLEDRTLAISGIGKMKGWESNSEEDWHKQYENIIQKVIIENGVTNIGDYAFNECSRLESTTIPEGVTSIGYDAFSRCSSLTNIDISSSVTSIRDSAFYECSNLIIYTTSNSEGHRYAEEEKQGYIIDDTAPTVTFTPNEGENV